MTIEIKVPDLGGATDVEVIDILVAVGDTIAVDEPLVTLESDKASMDVPASAAGTIEKIAITVGDTINEGDVIVICATAQQETNIQADSQVNNSDSTSSDSAASDAAASDAPDVSNAQTDTNLASTSDSDSDSNSSSETATPAEQATNTSSSSSEITSNEPASSSEVVTNNKADKAIIDACDQHSQLVVIGSGPGGYTAAFRAADLGMEVTLIEKYHTIGGVCLNVGCIPSKALLHCAGVIAEARDIEKHGISFGKPNIDIDKVRNYKDSVINKLTGGLASMAGQRNVKVVQGVATFTSSNSLNVDLQGEQEGKQQSLSFDQCIIAAGSRTSILPGFESDDPRVIDSTGALELSEIPKSLLIMGGGIIGLEMATVYAELGCEVTVVEYMPQIMPGADKDMVMPLQKRLKGIVKALHTSTSVEKLIPKKKGIEVYFAAAKENGTAPETQHFDKVLLATGRRPNGDRINAHVAGVNVDDKGFIAVDKQMRTNVANIFAIGDIVGQPMLAHKATHEAKVAAEVCVGQKTEFVASVIPSVAYTDPEVAWVGLTETEAKKNNISYDVGVFPWAASGRALGNDRTEGKTKLLFDPETERVLGGAIVGTGAGDLIAEIGLAIEMGADAADIGLTIHPHPTLTETIAMAAEAYEGTITDLYLPKQKKKADALKKELTS